MINITVKVDMEITYTKALLHRTKEFQEIYDSITDDDLIIYKLSKE